MDAPDWVDAALTAERDYYIELKAKLEAQVEKGRTALEPLRERIARQSEAMRIRVETTQNLRARIQELQEKQKTMAERVQALTRRAEKAEAALTKGSSSKPAPKATAKGSDPKA